MCVACAVCALSIDAKFKFRRPFVDSSLLIDIDEEHAAHARRVCCMRQHSTYSVLIGVGHGRGEVKRGGGDVSEGVNRPLASRGSSFDVFSCPYN